MRTPEQADERVRADFSRRVVIVTHELPWLASPQAGVERRMLDRIGGEVARATSVVRYAPASEFPGHQHGAGEEFLVLEGVFSDELGDYPAGTYVRNPPGSRHAPRTAHGCTILVKLRQMGPGERVRVVIDTVTATWTAGETDGHMRLELYAGGEPFERVSMERLGAGAVLATADCAGGEELFVLSGELTDQHRSYGAGTWIRNPAGYRRALSSSLGASFWAKRGHLPRAQ
ncbi:MAG TPA: cupin domain-containing protein [Steroidobacteraceae bacterium]